MTKLAKPGKFVKMIFANNMVEMTEKMFDQRVNPRRPMCALDIKFVNSEDPDPKIWAFFNHDEIQEKKK
jgi:hypothetical protein